jgi:aquaporin Z
MVFAVLVNRQAHLPRMRCAKLLHDGGVRCIHCGYEPGMLTCSSVEETNAA